MGIGEFVWRDLKTSDVAAAKTFYSGLLGWTFEEADMGGGMMYTMFNVNGVNTGGISPLDASAGAPPHWSSYLSVEDVDAAAKTATQNGGTLFFGPEDIPHVGRFAALADPQGAVFNFFKNADGYQSPEVVLPTPIGGVSWNELQTADPKAAMDYYSKLVGWTYDKTVAGSSGMDYWLAKRSAGPVAGIMEKPEMLAVSSWFIYFAVANLEASTAKVKELGGAIWMDEPLIVKGIGKILFGADPAGAGFALIEENFEM